MKRAAIAYIVAFGLIASLPLVGRHLRKDGSGACAFDGVDFVPHHGVRLVYADHEVRACSVGCAERWLSADGTTPLSIYAEDATGAAPVDVREAWFVRSRVMAVPASGDRTHVFGSESDARAHAKTYRGRVLTDDEIPLAAHVGGRVE